MRYLITFFYLNFIIYKMEEIILLWGFPGGSLCLQCRRSRFDPWVGKIPWKRERLPIPVFWPGEFHGLYSPWGHKESDTIEGLSLSAIFYLSCVVHIYSFTLCIFFPMWSIQLTLKQHGFQLHFVV